MRPEAPAEQQTPEAVAAARQEPAEVPGPQEPAQALAELREERPLAVGLQLTEALEPQVPVAALLPTETQALQVLGSRQAETRELLAQRLPARLAPDGFPLQAPSVPA